ncbi:MAG: hypothetical protein PHC78_10510 [Verrucomicrobiota bacterium]|nr:hypothetical protein [Verrucomicrobiota bacterium]
MTEEKELPIISPDNEFERESVPESHTKGLRSFVGMYAGEHAAGTEFAIGPLFLVHGVSAANLMLGLFLGNLMAVLSWMFLTAPIATRVRQTLYFQLERIAGVKLVKLYNIANGLMFCFLAGAMVSVSATAVGIPFNMKMPQLNDPMPNSIGWVIAVLVIGFVISIVAAKGYNTVSRFANIASPWMVLVFLACGIAAMPELGINSLSEFWPAARDVIWRGVPVEGQSQFTFWHVFFFAWFCNMAMHIGMSDLSIFRYAKKSWHAISTGAGVYIGHFMAWISASMLYAIQLQADPLNTTVAPGPMAVQIAGLTGAICVIIAGWTTANPTIYRSGLAFQSLIPKCSRVTATLFAGGLATLAGLFPALAMKLLDFVALYGLVLMPMGAVILIDFWVLPKLGMKSFFAEAAKISFHWGAGAAWILTLILCLVINKKFGLEIFFLAVPGWFLAAIIYIVGSMIIQKQRTA